MKYLVIVGAFLIIGGVVFLSYQGISYTTREKAIDIGPMQVTTEKSHTIPFAPVVGITILICGAGLVVMGLRRGCSAT